ncbi:hypothetical protein HELRODRAFT_178095 [Helobdella robusta]|uniref:Uncharacterized protein n=1 Tax=Helobdella robusta TaxID=6412 RepID=T1FCQ5_HELRO|nr:hypothetical protein HELRODRAFT_178095 [Helobdella robusta]ESN97310.1 hypothetical protein HELRODRAFT_178095 [Helobdella robusta]
MSIAVNVQLNVIVIVLIDITITTIVPYVTDSAIVSGGSLRDGDAMRMSLKGIERTLRYYQDNFREMNIDGIFALRLIQGQVSSLKMYLQANIHNDEDLKYLKRLEHIALLSEKIANKSVPHLEKMDDESMRLVGWVVTNPWTYTFNDIRLLNPKYFQTYKPHLLDLLNDLEDLSDFCIGEITKSCHLKDKCLNYILKDDTMSYELTHQRRHSKKSHNNRKNDNVTDDNNNNYIDLVTRDARLLHNDPLRHLEEKYCTYSFIEMSMILKKHDSLIPLHLIDIFAEHITEFEQMHM